MLYYLLLSLPIPLASLLTTLLPAFADTVDGVCDLRRSSRWTTVVSVEEAGGDLADVHRIEINGRRGNMFFYTSTEVHVAFDASESNDYPMITVEMVVMPRAEFDKSVNIIVAEDDDQWHVACVSEWQTCTHKHPKHHYTAPQARADCAHIVFRVCRYMPRSKVNFGEPSVETKSICQRVVHIRRLCKVESTA